MGGGAPYSAKVRTVPADPRVAFVQWLVEDFADEPDSGVFGR